MPDPNRLREYEKIGLRIIRSCENCVHAHFNRSSVTSWGHCQKFTYDHTKHVPPQRQLGVRRDMVCRHHKKHPLATRLIEYSGRENLDFEDP